MSVNTSSGCKLYIGNSVAVQPDPTADTFTEIGSIMNMGEFGRVYAEINFDDLSNRNTLKFKGQRNDGTMQVQLGRDAADAGQSVAFDSALDSDQDYNFKVELNDSTDISGSHPTIFYFSAKVFSYTTNVGTPSQVVQSRMNLGLKSGSITEIPAT